MPAFKTLRNKWKEILIGESSTKPITIYEKRIIDDLDKRVEFIVAMLCQDKNRIYLWKDEADFTNSQCQTNNYRRVLEMSKAYSIQGSHYYKSEMLLKIIEGALSFLYEHSYNANQAYHYGNWWNWEIGTPITLLNIMTLLGDDLSKDERHQYCEVINYYQPDPRYSGERSSNERLKKRISVGGNRVDTAKIAILLGIHTENVLLIKQGRDALSSVFEVKDYRPTEIFVEARDGLYRDGSFIQHRDVAYTGTYGNVMLGGLGEMLCLLNDSEWYITDPHIENIYQMIDKSFIPIIYKGHGMDCVNGRGASRQQYRNNGTGHMIMTSMLWFCQVAPQRYRDRYKERIKYWLKTDKVSSYIEKSTEIASVRMALAILEDDKISAAAELEGNFAYNYMDRMIHHRKHFACALSMSSWRIRTYETMLGENKRGFYTGDGMLYIYDDNQEAYNGDFWATVDPYKLTGITVVDKELEDEQGSFRTPSKWVSAMSIDDLYGIAGMQLDKRGINDETGQMENLLGIDLKAKKSYFMLDNEIVALGCDIACSNQEQVETIIDTRKINKEERNKIYQTSRSIYIETDKEKTSTGYYFLQEHDIVIEEYTRIGNWFTINVNGSPEGIRQDYMTLAINHGRMPKNASYAYIMIPSITREQMESYQKHVPIRVVANEASMQGIQYKNRMMLNFFEKGSVPGIQVSQPVCIALKDNTNYIEVTLCDPTKECEESLDLILDGNFEYVAGDTSLIELHQQESYIHLNIKWQKKYGLPITFILKNKLNSEL